MTFFRKRGISGREGSIFRGEKALLYHVGVAGFSAYAVVAVAVSTKMEGVKNGNIDMHSRYIVICVSYVGLRMRGLRHNRRVVVIVESSSSSVPSRAEV